jgi:hypothetical protein
MTAMIDVRAPLTLALLVSIATPAQSADWLERVRRLGHGAEGVEVTSQVAASQAEDGASRDALEQAARVANRVSTGAALAETGIVGTAIATGSGPTIMHTLAVAGGPAVLAGATGASAAKLMNQTLYANCEDEAACAAAQVGTYGGAAAGTAVSVGMVAAAGAGPAGLATIGGLVGGGMVAGVGVLVAAPVAAAAALGGVVYWVSRD